MKAKVSDPEFIATETLIVAGIARSVAFYRDVLGATVLREGEPTLLRLKNIWITRSTQATLPLRILVSSLRSAPGSFYEPLTTGIRRMDLSCFRKDKA